MVYFIEAEDGTIKIGYSADPKRRFAQIDSYSPLHLTLVAAVEGGAAIEHRLHQKFAPSRKKHEWFFPSDELCSLLKAAQEDHFDIYEYLDITTDEKRLLTEIKDDPHRKRRKPKKTEDNIERMVFECPLHRQIREEMSHWERQVAFGMLLGNGYLEYPIGSINPRLCMWHGKHSDANWTNYKATELKRFASDTPFTNPENGRSKWMSKCDDIWKNFQHICYTHISLSPEKALKEIRRRKGYSVGIKNVDDNWLDSLRDIAWTIWFLDKGKISRNRLQLRVGNHTKPGIEAILKYFNELGATCVLRGKVLKFDSKGTEEFLKVAAYNIPEYMRYRLRSR